MIHQKDDSNRNIGRRALERDFVLISSCSRRSREVKKNAAILKRFLKHSNFQPRPESENLDASFTEMLSDNFMK